MIRNTWIAVAIVLLTSSAAKVGLAQQIGTPVSNVKKVSVPPYHPSPPTGPMPHTLNPKQFRQPLNRNVYALAAKEKGLLYQLPCYCWCSKSEGHKCLLDCFRDKHASLCAVCKQEAVYAYLESRKGKAPADIRQGLAEGKWKTVDLTPYSTVRGHSQ